MMMLCFCRYHTDIEIKNSMAEIEKKHMSIASLDPNENELSMSYPQLKVTHDVSTFNIEIIKKLIVNFYLI